MLVFVGFGMTLIIFLLILDIELKIFINIKMIANLKMN